MKNAISIIITVRGNEPYLKQTIKNIRDKAGCKVEVVVVYDGEKHNADIDADQIIETLLAHGVGPARHRGIEAAEHGLVFLTDAHMDFSKNFGKLILEHHKAKGNESDISCGHCVPMFDRGGKLFWNEAERCSGTRFCLISDEPGGEKWIMSGKWAKQEPGPIGCVYGACYAFSKKWYEKIGKPLQLLTGWGMDEEYLSASTWLAGGRCVLLAYDAAHLFRAKPSFNTGRYDAILRLVNRARFVDLLPVDSAQREQFEVALNLNLMFHDGDFKQTYAKDCERPEVKKAIELWQGWKWDKLTPWIDVKQQALDERQAAAVKRRAVIQVEKPRTSTAQNIPTMQIRSIFQCPKCGVKGQIEQRHTETFAGEVRQYIRCKRCHHSGKKITKDSFEKILWNAVQ